MLFELEQLLGLLKMQTLNGILNITHRDQGRSNRSADASMHNKDAPQVLDYEVLFVCSDNTLIEQLQSTLKPCHTPSIKLHFRKYLDKA